MTQAEREAVIRQYAAGEISWRSLRERGFPSYLDVLAALGELGLKPPVAPMDGPNRDIREKGRAYIRSVIDGIR